MISRGTSKHVWRRSETATPKLKGRPSVGARIGRLPHGDPIRQLSGLDEPQGRLLRPCPDGELLPHAKNRTRPSPPICHTRESQTGHLCLHRRLLQPNSSPLGHRLYQPDRDGAKSSLTLSIFSGEDQYFYLRTRGSATDGHDASRGRGEDAATWPQRRQHRGQAPQQEQPLVLSAGRSLGVRWMCCGELRPR
jgi:hypothetical protein